MSAPRPTLTVTPDPIRGPAILERAFIDDDCGCPAEEWVYCGIWFQVHYNGDGTADLYLDGGDWDDSRSLQATDIDDARAKAFASVDALPRKDR